MTPTEMIPHLQDYYAEQVIDGLGRRDRAKFVRDVNVQFVQALEATNGLMFELCISLKPIYSIDLQPLVVSASPVTGPKKSASPTRRKGCNHHRRIVAVCCPELGEFIQ